MQIEKRKQQYNLLTQVHTSGIGIDLGRFLRVSYRWFQQFQIGVLESCSLFQKVKINNNYNYKTKKYFICLTIIICIISYFLLALDGIC